MIKREALPQSRQSKERQLISECLKQKGIGGVVVWEFRMTQGGKSSGRRFLDALILPNQRTNERYRWRDAPEDVRNGKALNGKRAILVQASDGRLGMYVMVKPCFRAI
jgi:hypothetical protein